MTASQENEGGSCDSPCVRGLRLALVRFLMSAALRQFAKLAVWLFVFAPTYLSAQSHEERKWVLFELKVPDGCQSWVLSETARDAAALYRMRGSCDRPLFFEMWPAF